MIVLWLFNKKLELYKMIKVLQLCDSIEKRNGRMSVIMNIYRNIDRGKIQFDFACTDYGFENFWM